MFQTSYDNHTPFRDYSFPVGPQEASWAILFRNVIYPTALVRNDAFKNSLD